MVELPRRKRNEPFRLAELRKEKGLPVSERARFLDEGAGATLSGKNLTAMISFRNVYKEAKNPANRDILRETMEGESKLIEHGLPIALPKGIVKIRGRDRLVSEKAVNLDPKLIEKNPERIFDIMDHAAKCGIKVDTRVDNFGITADKELVIRDTNQVEDWGKSDANEKMLKQMMFETFRDSLVDCKSVIGKHNNKEIYGHLFHKIIDYQRRRYGE